MKKSLFLICIIAIMAIFYYFNLFSFSNVDQIKEFVLGYGYFAPIVFILLFAIVPLTLFPDAILAIAGGLIFGLYEGTLYIIIGALCGATLSFYIARYYGSWIREKLKGENFLNIDKAVKKNGFLIILLLRLVPLVPFDIISYSAGFSSIRYKDFILASGLGIIPGVLVYANIGAQSLNFGSNEFYISISLLVALVVVSMMFKNNLKRKFFNDENS